MGRHVSVHQRPNPNRRTLEQRANMRRPVLAGGSQAAGRHGRGLRTDGDPVGADDRPYGVCAKARSMEGSERG